MDSRGQDSPSLVEAFAVQFGLAFFAVVVVGGRFVVCDADAESVLPDLALIALDEEAIGVGLVVVAALVLLVAADAARDFVFGLPGFVHDLVDGAVGCRRGVVIGVETSLEGGVKVSVCVFLRLGAVSGMTVARG